VCGGTESRSRTTEGGAAVVVVITEKRLLRAGITWSIARARASPERTMCGGRAASSSSSWDQMRVPPCVVVELFSVSPAPRVSALFWSGISMTRQVWIIFLLIASPPPLPCFWAQGRTLLNECCCLCPCGGGETCHDDGRAKMKRRDPAAVRVPWLELRTYGAAVKKSPIIVVPRSSQHPSSQRKTHSSRE